MTLLLVAKLLSTLFYALKKNTRTIESSSKKNIMRKDSKSVEYLS